MFQKCRNLVLVAGCAGALTGSFPGCVSFGPGFMGLWMTAGELKARTGNGCTTIS